MLDLWSRITFEFSKVRWGQSHWRRYLLWALIPALSLLLYRIIFQTRRRYLRASPQNAHRVTWPGLDSEFYELEKKLAARGLPRHLSEPLSEWLRRAAEEPVLDELRAPLQELLRLHYRYRFDPHGLTPNQRAQLCREAKACLAKIGQPVVVVSN